MVKFNSPGFSKDTYWRQKHEVAALPPAARAEVRRQMKSMHVVGVVRPGPSTKPVSKKALLKNTKRARRVQGDQL